MVNIKYIGLDEIIGWNIRADKIKEFLGDFLRGKGKIYIREEMHEEENYAHSYWRYEIFMGNSERMWMSCASRNVFDKIYDDVMFYNGKDNHWLNGVDCVEKYKGIVCISDKNE